MEGWMDPESLYRRSSIIPDAGLDLVNDIINDLFFDLVHDLLHDFVHAAKNWPCGD